MPKTKENTRKHIRLKVRDLVIKLGKVMYLELNIK